MPSAPPRTGGCLCGASRYEVRGELRGVVFCHCGQCRRGHGHHAAYAAAARRDVALKDGYGEHVSWFQSSPDARRAFCRRCGSNLFWEKISGDVTAVAAGTLDEPSGVRVVAHIYTDSAGDYYDIPDDGLPRYSEGLPP